MGGFSWPPRWWNGLSARLWSPRALRMWFGLTLSCLEREPPATRIAPHELIEVAPVGLDCQDSLAQQPNVRGPSRRGGSAVTASQAAAMRRSPDPDELGVEQQGEIFVTVLMLALVKLVNGIEQARKP
jgi:hypothetical protein